VILIWLTVFALMGITWIFWDPFGDAIIRLLETMVARFPGYYNADTVAFIRAFDVWFPVIVLLAAVLFVLVTSQRQSMEGYVG